jgi:hypothetical protein
MHSESLGILVFVAFCVAMYHMNMSQNIEVTQCPGRLLTRTRNLTRLGELGHLGMKISMCETKTITLKDLYEIRRLQKDAFSK